MNRQLLKLLLSIRSAGLELKLDRFDDRLILQKGVYLLQQAGVNLGYRYRWYLRGPYSSDLSTDLFSLLATADDDFETTGWNIDPPTRDILSRLRGLFQDRNGLAKKLELLGSVLFLIRTGQGTASNTEGIQKILLANDKIFSLEEVDSAIRQLNHYGFTV